MHIAHIYANGFRAFGPDNPLSIDLRRGLNILVGPNDAGKTAIIDAPRFVLWTRGDDFQRLEPSDFHIGSTGERANELLIRCTFESLSAEEEARFLEWCTNEDGRLRLHVCLRAVLRTAPGGGETVTTQYRSGKNADGLALEGDLREYLKATYLKPLRDAERELRSGRRSRLSRILGALPEMANQGAAAEPGDPPTLHDSMGQADEAIESHSSVRAVQRNVNTGYLDYLSFADDPLNATLGLGVKGSFDQLLERLELYLNAPPGRSARLARGLGYNNLLFMAAELLLLQSHHDQVPFLLLEEPEAHLHPQHQTLFMQVLERKAAPIPDGEDGQQVQVLLTTHSPQIAAGVDLESVIMVIGYKVFPLCMGKTRLDPDDYAFLRRFLDATKANLFFARGLVIVEGDAENILLPAIAEKMGRAFDKYGVSVVNVGHRGLFRYSRIFQRTDDVIIPIPVALIPDRDIPPDAAGGLVREGRLTEGQLDENQLATKEQDLLKDQGGCVRAFPSGQWTLEFDLALQPALSALVHQAIQLGKGSAGRTREEIVAAANDDVRRWRDDENHSNDAVATEIFAPLYKKQVSKAVAAEQLAALIEALPDTPDEFRRKLPAYLVAAIEYATNMRPMSEGAGEFAEPNDD